MLHLKPVSEEHWEKYKIAERWSVLRFDNWLEDLATFCLNAKDYKEYTKREYDSNLIRMLHSRSIGLIRESIDRSFPGFVSCQSINWNWTQMKPSHRIESIQLLQMFLSSNDAES